MRHSWQPASVWYYATREGVVALIRDGYGKEIEREERPFVRRASAAKRLEAAREFAEGVAAKHGLGAWQCFEDYEEDVIAEGI